MKIDSTTLVYFSPTHTTQKVLKAIAKGLGMASIAEEDLTPPDARTRSLNVLTDTVVLLGAPVYGGRLPQEAALRLRRLEGNDTPAVVVVVYGNRAYEDALLELHDLARERGFRPLAAAAFIGEHSFDSPETPIANGRPDAGDLDLAQQLGAQVAARLATLDGPGDIAALDAIPGTHPYKEGGKPPGITPVTRIEQCQACGACAAACPTAAITVDAHAVTDASRCILCAACVRACPHQAMIIEAPQILQAAQRLSTTCAEPKAPEIFGVPLASS